MTLTFEQLPFLFQLEVLLHVKWLESQGLQNSCTYQTLESDLKQEALKIWQEEKYDQNNILRNIAPNNSCRIHVPNILSRLLQYKKEWSFGVNPVDNYNIDEGYRNARGGQLVHNISQKQFEAWFRENNQLKEQNKELEKLRQFNQQIQTQLEQERKKNIDDQFQQQSQSLNELSTIALPDISYNFTQLKQEISRLKYQELAPQTRNKREELEQLASEIKSKAGISLEKTVNSLLETQKQIMQTTDTSQKDKLNGKLEAYQNVLEDNLTKEEMQTLLDKQTELQQLEKHLARLQQNQEQQAFQIQPAYGTLGSSGGNH